MGAECVQVEQLYIATYVHVELAKQVIYTIVFMYRLPSSGDFNHAFVGTFLLLDLVPDYQLLLLF